MISERWGRATKEDFRTIVTLVGGLVGIERHVDDDSDALPVERAVYWRQTLFLAHIPQLVLKARLDRGAPKDPQAFKDECRVAMNLRALVVLALDDAVRLGVPVVWPDTRC